MFVHLNIRAYLNMRAITFATYSEDLTTCACCFIRFSVVPEPTTEYFLVNRWPDKTHWDLSGIFFLTQDDEGFINKEVR